MSEANHLFARLRAASLGRESDVFAHLQDGSPVTFGALFDGAARTAAVLKAKGVKPGDRVAVQVEKTIAAIQVYLGTVMAGGVFCR